jgi:Helix-turn-helix domain
MPKTCTHLTLQQRALMPVLLEHKLSLRATARKRSRPSSTITREFARNRARLPDAAQARVPSCQPIAAGFALPFRFRPVLDLGSLAHYALVEAFFKHFAWHVLANKDHLALTHL